MAECYDEYGQPVDVGDLIVTSTLKVGRVYRISDQGVPWIQHKSKYSNKWERFSAGWTYLLLNPGPGPWLSTEVIDRSELNYDNPTPNLDSGLPG